MDVLVFVYALFVAAVVDAVVVASMFLFLLVSGRFVLVCMFLFVAV